jgi:hypothetical protein
MFLIHFSVRRCIYDEKVVAIIALVMALSVAGCATKQNNPMTGGQTSQVNGYADAFIRELWLCGKFAGLART